MEDSIQCAYCQKPISPNTQFKGVKYDEETTSELFYFCTIECAQYWSNGEHSPTAQRNIEDWHINHKED